MNLELLACLVTTVAVLYYLLPSPLNPVLWSAPPPLLTFDGPTAPNDLLSHAVKIKGNFSGPESTAIDGETGTVYVGLSDGTVGSFSQEGAYLGPVFFSGGFVADQTPTAGISDRNQFLMKWCNTESAEKRLAWSPPAEKKCGRPLGLRLHEENGIKYLYIMDAYHGLFKLNIAASTTEHLVKPDSPITSSTGSTTDVDADALRVPKFYNDLDISMSTGMIYFTDTSYKFTRSENRQEILDGAPRGRLLEYNPETKEIQVLLCGLHFPNGVQFLSSGEDLIVNDLARFRVLKVNPAAVKAHASQLLGSCKEDGSLSQVLTAATATVVGEEGTGNLYAEYGVDYFVPNMPGLVDNVRADTVVATAGELADGDSTGSNKSNYYLFGLGSKSTQPFSLLYFAYQSTMLRDLIGKVLPMQLVEKLVPKYGLVLVSNEHGQIVSSLHDPTGEISLLSQADRHPITEDLWLGSHSEALAILPAKYVPKSWE